jgi:hypothetical protein
MHIAREKIKNDIGGYLIYMFQIEDLIRACNFDHSVIEEKIINRYPANLTEKAEIKQWYIGLSDLMQEERLESKGHLLFLHNKISEVYEIHRYLISHPDEEEYQLVFRRTEPVIADLELKKPAGDNILTAALNAIYGFILLRMKNQEITASTQKAISQLSTWINLLSVKFSEYEKGNIQIE